jgi:hypothetical protein
MNVWDIFVSLLERLLGRTVVHRKNLPLLLDFLRSYLQEHGFAHLDKISDQVGFIILEEAIRRAAQREKDGQARTRNTLKETEPAAQSIIAVFEDAPDADARIKSILVFHKVI